MVAYIRTTDIDECRNGAYMHRKCIIGSCIVIGLLIIVIAVPVALHAKKDNDSDSTASGGAHTVEPYGTVIDLSVKDLVTQWEASNSWDVEQYLYGKAQCSWFMEDAIEVLNASYPAGSYNPSGAILGGFHFYAQPGVFTNNETCFSYDVMFPLGFDWVKGGKLPGVYVGITGGNGGNHIVGGYSYRPMWRTNGQAEAYLYVPQQLPEYYSPPYYINNGDYGDSLWRGVFNFLPGKWNSIKMYAKLNTYNSASGSPNYDGTLTLTINTATMTYSKMVWNNAPDVMISGIMMQSFFGGSDSTWATEVDTFIRYRNFKVANGPAC